MKCHFNNSSGKRHSTGGLWALFLVVCTLGLAFNAEAQRYRAVSKALDSSLESFLPANNAIDPGETNTVAFTFKNISGGEQKNVKVTMTPEVGDVGFSLTGQQTIGTVAKDATFTVAFRFRANGPAGGTLSPRFSFSDDGGATTLDPTDETKFDFQLGATVVGNFQFANAASITINDFKVNTDTTKDNGRASTFPSEITVDGVPNAIGRTGERVSNVQVTLNNVTHGYSQDIAAVLESPKGAKILLMRKAGGTVSGSNAGIDNVTLTFDAKASGNLPPASQITSGSFKPTAFGPSPTTTDLISARAPTQPYSTDLATIRAPGVGAAATQAQVDAINPNGKWKLYIVDSTAGDSGVVAGGWSLQIETKKVVVSSPSVTQPTISQGGSASIAKVTIDEDTVFADDNAALTKENSNGADHPKIATLPSIRVADLETAGDALTVAAVSGNEVLIKSSNIKLTGGTKTTDGTDSARKLRDYTMDFRPEPNANGETTVTITVTDAAGLSSSTSFTLVVTSVNDKPTFVSFPRNQTVNIGNSTPALAFQVNDIELGPNGVLVTGTSDTLGNVPNSNIFFAGSGTDRTVTIIPASSTTGSGAPTDATITVVASDGTDIVSKTIRVDFSATAGFPTISPLDSLTFDEDKSKAQSFTLRSGSSTPVNNIALSSSVTASTLFQSTPSANAVGATAAAALPAGSISFSGTDNERTVTVTSAAGYYGTATIQITATDSGVAGRVFNTSFAITVNEKNAKPTVTSINPVAIDEGSKTGDLAFTIGDRETLAASFVNPTAATPAPAAPSVTVSSSNTSIVSNSVSDGTTPGILIQGNTANRTIRVVPAANAFGKATITVTVTDSGKLGSNTTARDGTGGETGSTTFLVTVNAVNDPPTITLVEGDATLTATSTTVVTTVAEATATAGGTALGTGTGNTDKSIEQFLSLTGMTAGAGLSAAGDILEGDQTVTITAVSDKQSVIPDSLLRVVNTGDANANASFQSSSAIDRRLAFKTLKNAYGDVGITLTLTDNGGTDRGGVNTVVRKFKISVTPINDQIGLANIADQGSGAAPLSNKQGLSVPIVLTDVETSAPNVTLSATSGTTGVVAVNDITFDASKTRIAIVPVTGATGLSLITVTATDRGPKDDGTGATTTISKSFTVNFGNVVVSNPPSIDTINTLATPITVIISEEGVATGSIVLSQTKTDIAGATVAVTGAEADAIKLTGTSDNQDIVPNANILFGGSGLSRSVAVIPAAERFGNVNITITATDASGLSSLSKTLPVSIRAVEGNPTLTITKTADAKWSGTQAGNDLTFTLKEGETVADSKTGSGKIEIKVRDQWSETASNDLTITIGSDNTTLVPVANVVIDKLAAPSDVYGLQTRTVTITPDSDRSGVANITLTAKDNAGNSSAVAKIVLTVLEVNDAPVITSVTARSILQDSGVQTVSLSGINPGLKEGAAQNIIGLSAQAYESGKDTISAALITGITVAPTVSAGAPLGGAAGGTADQTATLTFSPVAGKFGTGDIWVTVQDNGGIVNGGKDTTVIKFQVAVAQFNNAPTINPIANLNFDQQNATTIGPIAVTVSDLETAATNLVVTVTSDNPTFLPEGSIVQTIGSGINRGLLITPAKLPADSTATTAIVKVVVSDRGDANGLNIKSAERTFTVTSTPAVKPTISAVSNLVINVNKDSDIISVTVADAQTPAAQLVLTASSDNSGLIANANIQFAPADAANPTVRRFIIRPTADQSGTANITLTVTDKDASFGQTSNSSATTSFQVKVLGEPPTITAIADQTVQKGGAAGPLSFTVGAKQTFPGFLTVTATTKNEAFLPLANILVGGSGANRIVTVGPVANTDGNSTVTLTVTDLQGQSSSSSFLVTTPVIPNTAPTISAISNQASDVDKSTPVLPFTVGDAAGETPATELVVTKNTSNPAVVPVDNIFLGGTGESRTLFVNPAAGASGVSTITLTVTDKGTSGSDPKSASTSFTVTVAANNAPTISSIGNQTTSQNTALSGIAFTVGDSETAAASLVVTAASDKATVVVSTGITTAGSGANRTVAISPVANASGTATVTLTVTDAGGKTATSSFTVTVSALAGVKGDFNGDRQPDLLFQDSGGFLATWYMNGGKLTSADFLLPSNVGDPAFRVAATADFNRDGQEDVLFQSTDGTLAVWLMNGTQQASASLLTPSNPGDRNWQVAASGDVNRDGKADIVFQHTDGTLAVWYMDGTSLSSAALIEPANAGAGWKVVAVGDLNADGKTDLIFQHTDGTLAMWAMDGSKLTSAALLDPSHPGDAAWKVVGAAPIAKRLSIALSGAAERPTAVTTTATGSGTATLIGDKLTFSVSYSGLSGAASAAHIHGPATTEQAAGVLIDLAPFNGGAFGASGTLSGTVTLTSAQLASVRDGLTYVNIHTAANPGGEVRGQIVANSAKAGQVDLIFQRSDLTLAVWYLDGSKLSSAALLDPSNSGGSWKVVGPK
ncbi:MAG: CHRD domain-containing protein [Verrucomicrobia bacterium]|nr:CHRD domain-containing protein [Verrucomicrobiota bacterium]